MALPATTLHIEVVLMAVNPPLKIHPEKVARSEWHHFYRLTLPFQRASAIWMEVLGGVTVMGLILGVLVVMRFLVAN
jgi:hypothetical protein